MTELTSKQYLEQVEKCRSVFINKNKDYGTSWRIFRIKSLVDQIYIKADRIRNLEEGNIPLIDENIESEYIGIINYSVITLIQLSLLEKNIKEIDFSVITDKYDAYIKQSFELMLKKNHDYGEAWRNMYISSFTDIILAKLLRIRSILENEGKTIISEGIEGNLFDMINYSFFALIKLNY